MTVHGPSSNPLCKSIMVGGIWDTPVPIRSSAHGYVRCWFSDRTSPVHLSFGRQSLPARRYDASALRRIAPYALLKLAFSTKDSMPAPITGWKQRGVYSGFVSPELASSDVRFDLESGHSVKIVKRGR